MPDDWDFSTKRPKAPPQPYITYGFAALCVVATIAFWYPGASPILARVAAIVTPRNDRIWDGSYWLVITSIFAHGSPVHLLFNLMMFVPLGRAMESELSPLAYIGFLVASGIVSSCCELGVFGDAGIGASGVVYAMFGVMWVGRAKYRSWSAIANQQQMTVMLIWGIYCIFSTYAGFMRVANGAHFGGLLFGLCIGWLFLAPRRKPIWAIPLVVLVALTGCSLFWLPWSGQWWTYRAGKAFTAENYRLAIDYYHKSLRLGGDRYLNWINIEHAWRNIGTLAERDGDNAAADQASQQADSALRLAGSNPYVQSDSAPSEPTFHVPGRKP